MKSIAQENHSSLFLWESCPACSEIWNRAAACVDSEEPCEEVYELLALCTTSECPSEQGMSFDKNRLFLYEV